MVMCQCSHAEVRGLLVGAGSLSPQGGSGGPPQLSASPIIIKPSQAPPFNLHLLRLAFKSLILVSPGVAVKVSDHPHSLCPAEGRTPNL